jgi:hypothetical protein
MSDDLDAVIMGAMSDAGLSGGDDSGSTDPGFSDDGGTDAGVSASDNSFTDLSAAGSADEGTDAGTAAEGDGALGQSVAPDAAAAGAADGVTPEQAEWDKELEELGIAKPKPGQRDNRLPYSRVTKIIANAKKKWADKLAADHEAALKPLQAQKDSWDNAEKLAATDPDRYIGLLATLYPAQYKKFLQQQQAQAQEAPAAAKQAAAAQDPEPQPDVKYSDGSLGFSPEQFAKLREWDRREAARQAKEETAKEFNERFGPIEQAFNATQADTKRLQTVRGHIDDLRETYGADVIDDPEVQKEIVAYMDANPKATLKASTRDVIKKRQEAERERYRADRTTMRAELLAELKAAPRAASKAPAAPVRAGAAKDESMDDIIRNAMRNL